MATQVQHRRGNTSQTSAFTGAIAEITVDTDKKTVVVHDGTTAGGFALARESSLTANNQLSQASFHQANAAYAQSNTNASNITTLQAVDVTQNTSISNIQAVDLTQNNNITTAQTKADNSFNQANAAYAQANTNASNITVLQAVNVTQNTSISDLQAVNVTQNTSISDLQAVNVTQNTNITTIQGVDNKQNTDITTAQTKADNAFNQANASFSVANNEVGVNATQNTNITTAQNAASAAFIRANNSIDANSGGTITGSLVVTGNLTVQGNVTYVDTETLAVEDSLLKLANNNTAGDVLDIGFYGTYNSTGQKYAGLARSAGTDNFFLFKGLTQDPSGNALSSGSVTAANSATLIANVSAYQVTINGQNIQTYATNAYNQANTNSSDITVLQAVNVTQNTNITTAQNKADAAFIQANNDVTNVSIAAGTYGNTTHYGVVSVAANGRVTSVATYQMQDPNSLAFAIALG